MVDPSPVKHVDIQITDNVNSTVTQQPVSPSTRSWARTRSAFGSTRRAAEHVSAVAVHQLGQDQRSRRGRPPCRWPRPDQQSHGRYFSGDMDWDDYISNQSNGWQKIWFNGEYALARARGSRTSVAPAPKARRTDNSARARAATSRSPTTRRLARFDRDPRLRPHELGRRRLVYKFTYAP